MSRSLAQSPVACIECPRCGRDALRTTGDVGMPQEEAEST